MTAAGQRIMASLTRKEQALCVAICEGKSTQEIGRQFGWGSRQLVNYYVHGVYTKTETKSRVTLAVLLFRHGIVECPCGSNQFQEKTA